MTPHRPTFGADLIRPSPCFYNCFISYMSWFFQRFVWFLSEDSYDSHVMRIKFLKALNADCSTFEKNLLAYIESSTKAQLLPIFSDCHGHDTLFYLEEWHLLWNCALKWYSIKFRAPITDYDLRAFPRSISWTALRIDDGVETRHWSSRGNGFLPSEGSIVKKWNCAPQALSVV